MLKTKLRSMAARDQPSEQLASMIAEICHLQKREGLAKDAQESAERSTAIAQVELELISKSKEEMKLQLESTRANLR